MAENLANFRKVLGLVRALEKRADLKNVSREQFHAVGDTLEKAILAQESKEKEKERKMEGVYKQ